MENVIHLSENNPIDLDLDNDMEKGDNVEQQISTDKSGSFKKHSRTFLSKWWSYFTILPGVDENGRVRATCKKCGHIVNAESNQGTGNIKKHVQKCHAVTYRDIGQM
ncbi:hypothetical protein FRX31_030613, partial [Thalictrum thalictroides]